MRHLEAIITGKNYGDFRLSTSLSDSRSSLQHFGNWFFVGDEINFAILLKLKLKSRYFTINIISGSHLILTAHGNEMAFTLAEEGCNFPAPSSLPPFSFWNYIR
ncbi:hypothetical protein TNCV_2652561 [Trichonephila clavipes]|nr:hypothetical protein TNCV_2652561 [Trichonephila clavipes]